MLEQTGLPLDDDTSEAPEVYDREKQVRINVEACGKCCLIHSRDRPALRDEIAKAQGGKCARCGHRLCMNGVPEGGWRGWRHSLGHRESVYSGGCNCRDNLQVDHDICNNLAGSVSGECRVVTRLNGEGEWCLDYTGWNPYARLEGWDETPVVPKVLQVGSLEVAELEFVTTGGLGVRTSLQGFLSELGDDYIMVRAGSDVLLRVTVSDLDEAAALATLFGCTSELEEAIEDIDFWPEEYGDDVEVSLRLSGVGAIL